VTEGPARRRRLGRALALGAAAAAALALFELGSLALVELGWLDAPRPSRGAGDLWWGDHPVFGVWHRPDAVEEHASRCFRVTYRTNSVGARDAERPRRAEGPRVVVLGDSFLEGWGVPAEERLSNRLEASTGVPHLNFAMAHFGPYQAYLLYRELARDFDHHAVILGVLPANDFADLDLELARTMEGYAYRYRPYLVGEPPDLRPFDYREPAWRRLLRHHSYAFQAVRSVWRARSGPGERAGASAERSFFYDFEDRQAALLEASLERLADAAKGRPVAVLLLPVMRDLRVYARSGERPDPLSRRLAAFARGRNLRIVNLLPAMAEHIPGWTAYFLSCDYHWSRYGHRVAHELVREALEPSFFRPGAPGADAAP